MISRASLALAAILPGLIGCNSALARTDIADGHKTDVVETAPASEERVAIDASTDAGFDPGTVIPLQAEVDIAEDLLFPTVRQSGGFTILLHPPQIRAWPDFASLDSQLALEITGPGDGSTRYGTLRMGGETEVLLAERIVRVTSPRIEAVEFAESVPDAYRDAVFEVATRDSIDVPLDLFLAYLADDVLSNPPPPGFNLEPPAIEVRHEPTVLLFIDGEPVGEDIGETGLQRIVNANWSLFSGTGENPSYYLFARDHWLTTDRLDGDWVAVQVLPDGFDGLPDEPEFRQARASLPYSVPDAEPPAVMFAGTPVELIVVDGPPARTAIEGTDGLDYVANTESLLFAMGDTWFFLVAGRWFSTLNMDEGPWSFVHELPAAFSTIPVEHVRSEVRASVPGTMEARMAALEAMLPTRVVASVAAAPPIEVSYAGDPAFEPVPGTEVSRAANTAYDVIQYDDDYYLLYSGIWYMASSPIGPWAATGILPDAIYRIPPSSPSYAVTQVRIVETTPTTIVYSYPPSYSTGVYVVYGVPYYGTGWYYPPYIWGRYYFPYYTAYGYGSWYNPATGGYASRSVWAGPYGGYSYNRGYNPSTGRYGYLETAWDGDEWASFGETYNPRTGVGTATSRYYDEDKQRSEMERTIERGSNSIRTEREIDFDDQTSRTQRTASTGGSSDMSRSLADGTISSSGEIRTGDGREFSISGEGDRAGGSTSISGATGSATIDTERRLDGTSVSRIEGSGGGSGISVSNQGPGRTTVGQSGSGDLYAGRNGNVYKKSDDGWQNYQDGGWQDVDVPGPNPSPVANDRRSDPELDASRSDQFSGPTRPATTGPTPAERNGAGFGRDTQARNWQSGNDSRDVSRLDRDYGARQRGFGQYEQRSRISGSRRAGGGGRRR